MLWLGSFHRALEMLRILDLLGFVGSHSLARANYPDSTIDSIRRLENALRTLATEGEVTLTLLRSLLLKVHPLVLLELRALLLHLDLVLVLESLDFLTFLLLYFI